MCSPSHLQLLPTRTPQTVCGVPVAALDAPSCLRLLGDVAMRDAVGRWSVAARMGECSASRGTGGSGDNVPKGSWLGILDVVRRGNLRVAKKTRISW